MPRRANADFHKAPQRFSFSTSHFAMPIIPACHGDERYMAEPSGDAIAAKQRNNISTTRGWTKCPDPRQAWPAEAGSSSPTRAVAGETSEQEEAASPANRRH